MSRWNDLMAGGSATEPPEDETASREPDQPTPAPAALDNSEFMGYLMAVLFPLFGAMIGCALIVRGNERGASIVGWSALASVIWTVALGVAWDLWLRG